MCQCDEVQEPPTLSIKPDAERRCTDITFLLFFIAFWGAIIAILATSIDQGADPNKIVRGVDYMGNICGKDSDVADLSLAAWPLVQYYDIKQCTNDCNITESFPEPYKSEKFLYYCLPVSDDNGSTSLNGTFGSASESASRAMADLWTVWPAIFASAFVALLFSYFYTWVARKIGACLIWSILLMLSVSGFLLGYALIQSGNSAADGDSTVSNRAEAMKGVGWFVVVATGIFVIVVFALRKRIEIAIEVMKEASRALADMPFLIFFPLVPFFIGLGYIAFWILITLYIFSVSSPVTNSMPDERLAKLYNASTYITYEWNEDMKNSFAVHFFHLLWNTQFLIYFSYFVVAGTVADWYFTPRNSDGEKSRGDGAHELATNPILDGCHRTCRFHLGTIAFGSMIMAVITFIRAVVRYIEEKTKSEIPNKVQRCFFCLIQCCLKCVECCMDKVSKNAFVWTAIYGDSFIPAACSSFALIWSNLARLAAINLVGDFLLFLGKIVVALFTTGLVAIVINSHYEDDVSSLVMPCVVIFLVSYLVSSLFMVIFDVTIDTVFLCFLIDEKFNRNGNMLAPASLVALVESHSEESAASANTLKKPAPGVPVSESGGGYRALD